MYFEEIVILRHLKNIWQASFLIHLLNFLNIRACDSLFV